MHQISHILVPVDFTKGTEKLVYFAMYVAGKFSAKVTLFHVSETYVGYAGFVHTSLEQAERELRVYCEEKMQLLVAKHQEKGFECTGKVVSGDTVDEILALAENERADLILIGTHGIKGIEKIILGSVVERVMKNAPCPTLTYNPYKEPSYGM